MERSTCFVLVAICLATVAGLVCAVSADEREGKTYTVRFAWLEVEQTLDKPLEKGKSPASPVPLGAVVPTLGSDSAKFLDDMRRAWPKLTFRSLSSLNIACVEDQTCTAQVNTLMPNESGGRAPNSISESRATVRVQGRKDDNVLLDWDCTFTRNGHGGGTKSSPKLELGKTHVIYGAAQSDPSNPRTVKSWVMAVSVVPGTTGTILPQDSGPVLPALDTK